jgi:hypothetical protein
MAAWIAYYIFFPFTFIIIALIDLNDIFCTFGASSILQSDNGREFVNFIIDELKNMWPQLKIVHGKPRHS